jgi:hypothetical protein
MSLVCAKYFKIIMVLMQNIPVFMLKLFWKVFKFLFRPSASTIAASEKVLWELEQRNRFILEN